MAVNLDSMFLTSKVFLPGMRERKWGRIVNMASNTLGLVVPWGFAHYIASKGGVIGLTRALASEYGGHGITVNAISPGLTRSPGTISLFGCTDSFATYDNGVLVVMFPRVAQTVSGTITMTKVGTAKGRCRRHVGKDLQPV
jgi:NAD(P)-dependent dehydrogenase (short-subunit alcohol dehydrogenase family)